jgi:general secretion pathway protein D
MVTEITQLIENTVARNSWIDNGGTVGSVREINGQLVITQTPNNLEKVSGLLKQLRETRSVEISIDARFLYVTTGFLNDFGFSWSLGFGNMFGSDVGTPGTVTNPTTGAQEPGITAPVSITNNTTTYAAPQTTGVTNSIGGLYSAPSLSLSGGILSNYQLSLLLNATQINKRNTLLEAPRITLFNGQRATMIVEDVQNYVQSFTQTAGTGGLVGGVGGVATNLNVLPLTTGLSLSVQATVSSDDRYVIMTIIPSLSQLLSLQTFNINGQNTTTAGASTALPGFVQLPQTQITEVSTTVSVPDGGTLLLGGERLAGETTIEAGVPVLSQIPIINRLFTNSSTTKDNLVLLILVRPRIIIQKEFEKKQFGRNY